MTLDAYTQLANVAIVAQRTTQRVQAMRAWPEAYWQRATSFCDTLFRTFEDHGDA